ncbi:MAG: phasin family protein, partial [Acetobacteraceae bacterium]|nr:phasin family protein [Acetobacteraceae bacterium]
MSDTSNQGQTGAGGTTGASASTSGEGRGQFPDLTAILSQFKLPGVDLQAIMESRKADFEALMKANTLAIQGAQKIAEKQAELFRASLNDL